MLNENFGGFNDFDEILEWGINRVGMKAAYTRNKMYVE